jgi:hypothetical protein
VAELIGSVDLTRYTPDTSAVIHRVRVGKVSDIVADYMATIPLNQIVMLKRVYDEVNRTFQKTVGNAGKAIMDAANEVAKEKGVKVVDLPAGNIDEVLKRAFKKRGRDDNFYASVEWRMKQLGSMGENPYLMILPVIFDAFASQELDLVRKIFNIRDADSDCLRCSKKEEKMIKDEVMKWLVENLVFFANEKHSRDLEIAGEFVAVSRRSDLSPFEFFCSDDRFESALKRSIPGLDKSFAGRIGQISTKLVL